MESSKHWKIAPLEDRNGQEVWDKTGIYTKLLNCKLEIAAIKIACSDSRKSWENANTEHLFPPAPDLSCVNR